MTVEISTKDGREILTLVPKSTKEKMMEVSWDPMKPWKDACTAYYKAESHAYSRKHVTMAQVSNSDLFKQNPSNI